MGKAMELTESMEDYLRLVYELGLDGEEVGVSALARRLSISAPSVTNMAKRLAKAGLIRRAPYRGLTLTEEGRKAALGVVRRHRLVELYLVEVLGYSWEDVHEEAEKLEHAVSDTFTERLAELLGHPDYGPHGDPIPADDGTLEPDRSFPLPAAAAGQRVLIARVGHETSTLLTYLGERGLVPGRLIRVEEARALDGVITVADEDGTVHSLGAPLAGTLFVRSAPEDG
ncbi:MAG: metal-dependent transcriptional regulator [Actinomycetota bacterium]|nr:metal-dependent transcriptional regulator [Actinomycetota bacterium]MDQ3428673.1 metal-dependent transcriptional regulator [Actinomycetota bacterium]